MNQFVVIMAYIVFVMVLGIVLNRIRKDKADTKNFFVAGGGLGALALLPLLFGELIAGASTTGTATGGMTAGLSGLYAVWGNCLGCFLVAFVLVKFFSMAGRHNGAMSAPEAISIRLGNKARYVVAAVQLITGFIVFALQIKAAAVLLSPMIGIEADVLSWFIGALFFAMALLGLKGVSDMNVIHSILLFFGLLVVCVICVNHVGGLGVIATELPSEYYNFAAPGWETMVASLAGGILSFSVSAAPSNLSFSSKNVKVAKHVLIIGGACGVLFGFFPLLIGMSGAIAMPDAAAASILYLMPQSISPWLATLATMAVIAAIFSSGPFFLLYFSAVITQDFLTPIFKITDEKKRLLYSRIAAALFAFFGIVICNALGSILASLLGAFQIQSCITIGLIIALFWKRATDNACTYGILFSGLLAAVWFFVGNPFGVQPLWPALALEILIIGIWSLVANKKPISDDFQAYLDWKKEAQATLPELDKK